MFSWSDHLLSALQVCVVPANSSWIGVFAVLSEKDCRKEGEKHIHNASTHKKKEKNTGEVVQKKRRGWLVSTLNRGCR